jgi:GR25 family glycosyltransferase involved in LPS biosynthesis
MVGCYASNLAVMDIIVKHNISQAVIIEDDVFPVEDFDKKWNEVQPYIPKDFDILLLSHIGQTSNLGFLSLVSYFTFTKRRYKYINKYISIPYFPLGTASYLISNKGAKIILEKYNQIKYHIDLHLYTKDDIKLYTLNNFLIKNQSSEITLGYNHNFSFLKKYKFNTGQNLNWYLHTCAIRVKSFNLVVWHIICLFLFCIFLTMLLNNKIPLFCFLLFISILIVLINKLNN